jgi:hypothetical protein
MGCGVTPYRASGSLHGLRPQARRPQRWQLPKPRWALSCRGSCGSCCASATARHRAASSCSRTTCAFCVSLPALLFLGRGARRAHSSVASTERAAFVAVSARSRRGALGGSASWAWGAAAAAGRNGPAAARRDARAQAAWRGGRGSGFTNRPERPRGRDSACGPGAWILAPGQQQWPCSSGRDGRRGCRGVVNVLRHE